MSTPGSTDVDVVVVGAGISGLATAFDLQRRGLAVDVLDAATPCRRRDRHDPSRRRARRNRSEQRARLHAPHQRAPRRARHPRRARRGERRGRHAIHRARRQAGSAAHIARARSLPASAFTPGAKFRLWREPFIAPAPARRRGVRSPRSSAAGSATEISGLRDRPVRGGNLCWGSGADLGFRRIPPHPRARAEIRQPDQGPVPGVHANAGELRGKAAQRGRKLLLPQRHADADRCARAGRRRASRPA